MNVGQVAKPARRLPIGANLRGLATRAQDGILPHNQTEPLLNKYD